MEIIQALCKNTLLYIGYLKVRMCTCTPYPHACRKRRLKWSVFPKSPYKGLPRVDAWTGKFKNLTKCLWRWEPDRRSNSFFNPPAHLCAVTYITEISLYVT